MNAHPYGWLSLLPPVAAIVLAIATRRVIPSLLAGVLVGALVTSGGDPIAAAVDSLELHLWRTLVDEGKLRVFSFTLLMGAMVGVINRCGGMRGLVDLVSPWASNRRRGQLTTWLLGLLVFFDDYANTLLLGNTLRPLCDRLRISREKLAYLVDSTAAPVAGLALVSTWVAVEIEYISEGIKNVDVPAGLNAFQLFLESIPYRFYVLMALVFVPLTAILGREFGPMLAAERACLSGHSPAERSHRPILHYPTEPDPDTPSRWYNAVAPIGLTLGVVVWLIYATGEQACLAKRPGVVPSLTDIFGEAASSLALQYGALAGLLLVAVMARVQSVLDGHKVIQAAGAGARLVLPAVAILWLASTVSRMTSNISADGAVSERPYQFKDHRLYTGDFLRELLEGEAPPQETGDGAGSQPPRNIAWLLPTIVFAMSAAVAFCTGTSWGTMGIIMPTTIALAYALLSAGGRAVGAGDPILLSSIGGVLSGAVFGDHCSPISDTTVLSSQSSGCDHIAHVWTQMPYAVVVGLVCIVCGTLPLGLGVSVWVLLPLQIVAIFVCLLVLGRKVEIEGSGHE